MVKGLVSEKKANFHLLAICRFSGCTVVSGVVVVVGVCNLLLSDENQ